MTDNEIRRRIIDGAGIDALNALQTAVLNTAAPDTVLIAPTGSGKTLAFAITVLRGLDDATAGDGRVKALIIAPSRELVLQITQVLRPVARGHKVLAMYGGNAFSAEEASVRQAVPDIVVATPGRLLDHLNRGTLAVDGVCTLVVDEYDKTLELGFADELRRILGALRGVERSMLTSATAIDAKALPRFFANRKLHQIDASADDPQQRTMIIGVPSAERDKLDTLAALLRQVRPNENGGALVFVNHREAVDRTVEGLKRRGIDAWPYHGGQEQRDREIAVAAFRAGAAPVLVGTDLAARGLDIEGVGAVVHYHQPLTQQAWTHRNGRTARAGASGTVYVIKGPDETVPEYVVTDHDEYPDLALAARVKAAKTLLYVNAGRRDKISRGDIAGFILKQCQVPADALGRIELAGDYALAAVDPAYAQTITLAARNARLKNKKVRITAVKD